MSADRSDTTRDKLAGGEEPMLDPTAAIVRAYGAKPPYEAIDWTAVTARIVAGASSDLDRRRAAARWTRIAPDGRRARAWWEIAASWARPAIAAAVVTVALTGTLVATSGATTQGEDTSTSTGTTLVASTDGVDAVMFESPTTTRSEGGVVTRDSLFSALVNGR